MFSLKKLNDSFPLWEELGPYNYDDIFRCNYCGASLVGAKRRIDECVAWHTLFS